MIDVRDNWRILLLLVLCLVAAFFLFGPIGGGAADTSGNNTASDPTNLQYGLELAGGTRVRGQLEGLTTEDAGLGQDTRQIERTVAEELDIDSINVRARADTDTVELYSADFSPQEFASALGTAGLDVSTDQMRSGVTEATRDEAVGTIQNRVDRTGLSGTSVSTVSSASGGDFIVVEVPGADQNEVRDLIGDPRQVQIIATNPTQGGNGTEYAEEEVLTSQDFSGISSAVQPSGNRPAHVPVTLTDDAAERFTSELIDRGFTSPQGTDNCRWRQTPDDPGYCLYTVVDGNVTYAASMSPGLANTIQSGDFELDPQFIMNTNSFSEAQELEFNLKSGALPTELAIESVSFRSPSLAQAFKPLALFTGLAAWITVSLVVYFWYRDPRVAVPMLITASTEVFLLLGFAAAVGLALDLSHIAGLIAVIGTGLDDLIIMADEILQRKKKVDTGRVYQRRYKKAFWIIGMAAATTIVAMSPLAVLSLGDLRGFAIITIVGVLIGVGITRPAYGDILRKLMLDDVKRS